MNAEDKVLDALRTHGKSYYAEIKRHARLSHSSLQNALRRLEEKNLVEKERTTGHAYFAPKETLETYLRFAAHNQQDFDNLNNGVRIPLKEFLKNTPREMAFIILFGSASRKKETAESDIDILVVMNTFADKKLQALYEKDIRARCETARAAARAISQHSISLAFTTTEDFLKNDDHLLKQARRTGFPIQGHIRYYEVLRDARARLL